MDTLPLGSPTPSTPHHRDTLLDAPDARARRWDKRIDRLVGGCYRLRRRIGNGSGGAVYEARHEPSGERVAVKILHERFKGSDQQRRRFEREARTAAVIHHPHIVRLYHAGCDPDGTAWQVLELLAGRDLASALEERPLAIGEVRALAGQLLSAIEAVHTRGFVHRDVKPENVFLLDEAPSDAPLAIKLLDFGIAKPLVPTDSLPFITEEGVLLGTPHYMAPEQVTGEQPVSPATDLWAVGAVLFTALTGRAPFEEAQLSRLLVRIAREPAPSVGFYRPDVPTDLAEVVARALRTHPAHRYHSARQMRAALG